MGFHASRRSGVLLAAAVLLLPTLPLSAQVPEATTAALKQIFDPLWGDGTPVAPISTAISSAMRWPSIAGYRWRLCCRHRRMK